MLLIQFELVRLGYTLIKAVNKMYLSLKIKKLDIHLYSIATKYRV